MKQYTDAFQFHKDIEDGKLDVNYVEDGIWRVLDTDTAEEGYVFSDETEMFHPIVYETVKEALKGRSHYCKTML